MSLEVDLADACPSPAARSGGRRFQDRLERTLSDVRTHLNMDVAYIAERAAPDRFVLRVLDTGDDPGALQVGAADPYSALIGSNLESVWALDDVSGHGDGGYRTLLSVPIHEATDQIFGVMCCVGRAPRPDLNTSDLAVMRVFADLVGDRLRGALERRQHRELLRLGTQAVLEGDGLRMAYQPIVDLVSGRVTGFEALARFADETGRSPDRYFADAQKVQLDVDLELAAISRAVTALTDLPKPIYVAVNAGPGTLASGRLGAAFGDAPLGRIVLEVTEHDALPMNAELLAELEGWRDKGVALAVDDAGAGYSGLQQIVRLKPDLVKLDVSLIRGIDQDTVRRSLVAAMVHFAQETGAKIVAEGIEHRAEADTLASLGVHRGQGWWLGRPMSPDAAIDLVKHGSCLR